MSEETNPVAMPQEELPEFNEIGGRIHYAGAHLKMLTDAARQQTLVKTELCKHGMMCYCPHDVYIGRSLEVYGEYSEGEVDLFAALLKENMVVIEVGANMGSLTVPLAKIVGPGGRVFAFEPQRIVFQQMCANVAINAIWHVWAEHLACGAKSGVMGVPPINYGAPLNFGGVSLVEKAGEMVGVVALDDSIIQPHFLKVDVEGMELEVLKGAEKMINRFRPVLYVENDRKEKSEALIDHIRSRKYKLYWHTPTLWNPDNFRKSPDNIFGNVASLNMLCVPEEVALKVDLPPVTGSLQ